jgi:FMN phosphatase YigB (HAD superfamily)
MDRASTASGRSEAQATPPAPDGDARLAAAFEQLAGDDRIRVLSLDVFDTLLFRKLHEPVDAFPLIAIRLRERGALAEGVTAELFAKLRRAAEERARERVREEGRGVEVTLDQIHQALPASLFARDLSAADLGEIECEVERELLVPDLDVLALVREARDSGRTVIVVSDTYFSERQLRLFMARGPLDPAQVDRVFPSSRYGTGKASGLFSVVLEELGCRPEEVLHIGDNHFSDVVAPGRLGIQTMYFERRPPALERALAREALQVSAPLRPPHGDHGLSALRAKVSHRVEGTRQPEGLRPFWDFGAAVLGPPFAGFAEWVHEQARRAGCSKALCLMREGQLLASLINSSPPADGGVTAEPLWLSRQVCARAMITNGTREELEQLWMRRRLPTLREYATALGLSLDDLPAFADQAERRMDDAGFGHEVADVIVGDAALRSRVVATSRELRRRILRYVDQLRPPGEPRLLLVDLGWGATIQATLEQLLRQAGADYDTLGLYLVTSEPAAERLLEGVESHGFLATAGLPVRAAEAVMRSPEVLEQICMPDHGSQIDLTEDLRPVLAEADEFSFQSVQRAAVQQGIAAFAREWRRYRERVPGALPPLWDGARDRLLAMVARAVAAPTADEAALFGGWMHDENFGSDRVESVVASPAARALPYLEPQGLVDIPMTELYWPFGLAAMHDEHLAASVAAASGGAVPWEAFSSRLETGPFEVYADLGWGFEQPPKAELPVRRNRRGLSLAKATVRGDFVKRLRLHPAADSCVLRIDWISMRCRVHGRAEPVMVEISSPRDFGSLKLRGCHWIGPRLLMVPGTAPQITVDVERPAGGRVYSLDFECAFAALPVARSQARERWGRLKAALRNVAKEWRIGAPLRLAKRALTRLRGG